MKYIVRRSVPKVGSESRPAALIAAPMFTAWVWARDRGERWALRPLGAKRPRPLMTSTEVSSFIEVLL